MMEESDAHLTICLENVADVQILPGHRVNKKKPTEGVFHLQLCEYYERRLVPLRSVNRWRTFVEVSER